MRVIWHPYTDDSPEAQIDVTGWHPAHIMASAIRLMPKHDDCVRLHEVLERRSPFNDPRLGCLVFVE